MKKVDIESNNTIVVSNYTLITGNTVNRGAFVLLVMGAYWITEAIPLAITALMPLVLFPLFGILSTEQACQAFMNQTLMIFIASLMAAVAVESSNLHNRISIKVLLLFGTSPKWLLLGFMLNTMFLSMWISNTATTALMIPIVDAVLVQLRHRTPANSDSGNRKVSIISNLDLHPTNESRKRSGSSLVATEDPEIDAKSFYILRKSLFLGICYAANIGGIGTLTGTGPNLILYALLSNKKEMRGIHNEITFSSWMTFNVPSMLLCGFIAWLFIVLVYIRKAVNKDENKERDKVIRSMIQKKNELMGDVTFHEWSVLILFVSMILLWFFRNPSFTRGWSPLLINRNEGDYIGDASPAFFIVILLFMIPSNPKNPTQSRPLLEWNAIQEKLPWNIVILVGGAFVLAKGTQASGLSDWFSQQLARMQVLSPSILLLIICIIALSLTEITSNSATATVILPSIKNMALKLGFSPLFFMLPVTVCCSFAFMLPIGSATNAIVFEAGELKSMDMIKPGIFMKVACLVVILVMINTWGFYVFNFNDLSSVNNSTGSTLFNMANSLKHNGSLFLN
uniref:Citrate transporter-like domain-containing protein n=1 Tax=Tetranychus urticae TaxID=32264 RepID=T1K3L9_TETUR